MTRSYNFSAGPSALPLPVLERAAAELSDYRGLGLGVMELSHRSEAYRELGAGAERRLRELMAIPEAYRVLFLQGGATTQFAMIPQNLCERHRRAGFIDTGNWSCKAIAEAAKLVETRILASGAEHHYCRLPDLTALDVSEPLDYLHLTTNNTIRGTRYPTLPDIESIPLVADISSHILGESIDVTRFGLLYAGAQKNLGPAGVTVVIVREDLIRTPLPGTPTMHDYRTHIRAESAYNTPPTFAIYMVGLVLDWVAEQGGIDAMERLNREKSGRLYEYLDQSRLFQAIVEPECRSWVNVPFVLPEESLTALFLEEARHLKLYHLKGHKSVGGLRASLYNGVPLEAVNRLVAFMESFEKRHRISS